MIDNNTIQPTIQPFDPAWLYRLIRYAARLMILFALIILWPSNPLRIPGRTEFASGYLAALVALWLFLDLMKSIPETFKSLWLRGALDSRSREALKKSKAGTPNQSRPYQQLGPEYQAHVQELTDALNGKGQWWLAGFFVVLVLGWYLSYGMG